MRADLILVDGPYSAQNREGDEVPEWHVCAMTDSGDVVGTVYRPRSYSRAVNLGEAMSRDRDLELVNEAGP